MVIRGDEHRGRIAGACRHQPVDPALVTAPSAQSVHRVDRLCPAKPDERAASGSDAQTRWSSTLAVTPASAFELHQPVGVGPFATQRRRRAGNDDESTYTRTWGHSGLIPARTYDGSARGSEGASVVRDCASPKTAASD
jgi:hypothetical protein